MASLLNIATVLLGTLIAVWWIAIFVVVNLTDAQKALLRERIGKVNSARKGAPTTP